MAFRTARAPLRVSTLTEVRYRAWQPVGGKRCAQALPGSTMQGQEVFPQPWSSLCPEPGVWALPCSGIRDSSEPPGRQAGVVEVTEIQGQVQWTLLCIALASGPLGPSKGGAVALCIGMSRQIFLLSRSMLGPATTSSTHPAALVHCQEKVKDKNGVEALRQALICAWRLAVKRSNLFPVETPKTWTRHSTEDPGPRDLL